MCKRGGIKGQLIDTVKLIQYPSFWYNARMRKNRVIEQNRCYHLVSRLAHRAFFLDDEEKDRAVALMRRVEEGVQASMSYCINRAVSISPDPFVPHWELYQARRRQCAGEVGRHVGSLQLRKLRPQRRPRRR